MSVIIFIFKLLLYFILFLVVIVLLFVSLAYISGFLVPRDEQIQEALNKKTDELLNSSIESLLSLPRYEQHEMKINNTIIKYGLEKYSFNDNLVHIVLHAGQDARFGFHYKFLNGIKVLNKNEVLKLTDEETGDYD